MKKNDNLLSDRPTRKQRWHIGPLLRVVVFAALISAAGAVNAQTNKAPTEATASGSASVIIPIEGMSCSACVARVRKTLKAIKGVAEVRVSLGERQAEVQYQPRKTSPEKLAKAINELGYKAGKPKTKEKSS